jgi:hypothetical protein
VGRGRLRRADEAYRDAGGHGRHRRELTPAQKLAIQEQVRKHPHWGVGRLRGAVCGLPRNTTAAYLRRLRRVRACRRRRMWRTLEWTMSGAVWAIDGTWLDLPVTPCGRRALVVVELHSRQTLCLESVPGERAASVVACLEGLFEQHGAPLVIKADNGSAFIADAVAELCRRHGITLLHSPVRRPRYNGTCEVSGRWAKHRALAAASQRGPPERLCQEDLDHAITFTGTMPRIDDALRQSFLATVDQEQASVAREQGLVIDDHTPDDVRRSLTRVAVQRALLSCHMLTIRGREYPRCLPAQAA